jgi:hypothetical protein
MNRVNIHDYLDKIPAPPVDPESLKAALNNVTWCASVEEAAELIIKDGADALEYTDS